MAVTRNKTRTARNEKADGAPGKNSRMVLIHGDDDYLIAEEARKIVATLMPPGGSEFNLEMVDGIASNQAEADAIFRKLFEALQTQSFFATEKVVWWRNTNLLGTEAVAEGAGVRESLNGLAKLLKAGLPAGFALVVTATGVDARKSLVRAFQEAGNVVAFKKDSYDRERNEAGAIRLAREAAARLDKQIEEGAALLLVEMTTGDSRTLVSEIEKLAAYSGEQKIIGEEEVRAVASRRPGGLVWDLADAVTERNLARVLRVLDDLLFMGEEPVGLFFTLVTRLRLLLFLSVLSERKVLKCGGDYASFKSQLDRLPASIVDNLPADKKLNPLAGHPYALWKASAGVGRYSPAELRQAMVILLECNERMFSGVGSHIDHLKEALIRICVKPAPIRAS